MDTELKVEVFEPAADDEAVDQVAQNLREELLQLDVSSVSPAVAGPAPEGSKAVSLAAIGAIIVAVKGSAEAIDAVVSTVRAWLKRSPAPERTLRLTLNGQTLELTAATAEQQQALVDQFVRAATQGEAEDDTRAGSGTDPGAGAGG